MVFLYNFHQINIPSILKVYNLFTLKIHVLVYCLYRFLG